MVDSDGSLARMLQGQVHRGDPDGEGVVWPVSPSASAPPAGYRGHAGSRRGGWLSTAWTQVLVLDGYERVAADTCVPGMHGPGQRSEQAYCMIRRPHVAEISLLGALGCGRWMVSASSCPPARPRVSTLPKQRADPRPHARGVCHGRILDRQVHTCRAAQSPGHSRAFPAWALSTPRRARNLRQASVILDELEAPDSVYDVVVLQARHSPAPPLRLQLDTSFHSCGFPPNLSCTAARTRAAHAAGVRGRGGSA